MQQETKSKTVKLPDAQTVTSVEHWSDRLFSFRITRPQSLRFRSGEFVMIGLLRDDGKPLLRAYSIASPNWDEELEFYSIKVQNGPLTSRLQHIQVGDEIILSPKPVGTLVHDALLPGKRIWFFATGTGIAPFASLIRDPETYENYDQVILTHTCRNMNELAYSGKLVGNVRKDPLIGEYASQKLIYYPTTTRDISKYNGRITNQIVNQEIFKNLNLNSFNKDHDRIMICGSLEFNNELKNILWQNNFIEGATNKPGEYVLEKAFVG